MPMHALYKGDPVNVVFLYKNVECKDTRAKRYIIEAYDAGKLEGIPAEDIAMSNEQLTMNNEEVEQKNAYARFVQR